MSQARGGQMVQSIVLWHDWKWVRAPPMLVDTCASIKVEKTAKKPADVTPEVNLRNPLNTGDKRT